MTGNKKNRAKKKRSVSKHVLKASKNQQEKQAATKKEPSDASNYLLAWENQRNGEGTNWKFNKNTQSWLIRHMYDIGKVSKSSFDILLKYLEDLKGATARSRARAEASRRALRYKEYAKKISSEIQDEDIEKPKTGTVSSEDGDEQKRWANLDEHDKRKEYKRSRKILEAIPKEE